MCIFLPESQLEGNTVSGFSPLTANPVFVVYSAHVFLCLSEGCFFLSKMSPKGSSEGNFSIPKAEMCLQRNGVLGLLHPACSVVPLALTLIRMNQQ